jgi:hypothetical protein
MNKLENILDEFHKYLMLRKLAKTEHVPYLVRWVKEFLQFARDKTATNSRRLSRSCAGSFAADYG